MAEYAPANLKWLGSRVGPDLRGVLSGIIGDSAHTYGYHRCRFCVGGGDYSTQLSEDRQGDGYAVSGIDMSFSDSLMRLYTSRLKTAADQNDPRIKNMREFYGTLDSNTVYGRTHAGSGDSSWERSSADSSHLWHIHISVLRKFANDKPTMQGILDVMLGKPLTSPTPTPVKGKKMFFVKVKNDPATFLSDGVHRRAVNSYADMKVLAAALGISLTAVETDTWDHLNKLAGKLVAE
jgi:hypothetical protein